MCGHRCHLLFHLHFGLIGRAWCPSNPSPSLTTNSEEQLWILSSLCKTMADKCRLPALSTTPLFRSAACFLGFRISIYETPACQRMCGGWCRCFHFFIFEKCSLICNLAIFLHIPFLQCFNIFFRTVNIQFPCFRVILVSMEMVQVEKSIDLLVWLY